MKYSCCFTGHRLSRLSGCNIDKIRAALSEAISDMVDLGVTRFYTGMADGIDLIAADQVLCRYDAQLVAVVPFENHIARIPQSCRQDYERILSLAHESITLMPRYMPSVFQMRNDYMVSHAANLIAVYDGLSQGGTLYTIRRARSMNRNIVMIDPLSL